MIISFILISCSSSSWALSPFMEASSLIRSTLRLTPRAIGRFYSDHTSVHPYAVATYDNAFKDIMMEETARNSFFESAIDQEVASSELISLSFNSKKGHDQDQIAADTIGDFLAKYEAVISTFVDEHPPEKRGSKKPSLSLDSFAKEIAYKYYKPLCNLFPSQSKKGYMDFSCRLKNGDKILVETQVRPQDYWNQRALAYAARVYSSQLMEGEFWGKLKKVYSINILGGVEFSGLYRSDTHSWENKINPMKDQSFPFIKRYEITNTYDANDKIPHLQIIQLFPQLFDSNIASKANVTLHPSDRLKEWLELFKEAHKKDKKYVMENVKDQGVKSAYDILARHEPGDQYKAWKENFGPKIAEQFVQEAAAAKEEGKAQEKRDIAKRLVENKKLSDQDISDASGLHLDEIKKLRT